MGVMATIRAELYAASQGGTILPKQTAHLPCQAWSIHHHSDQALSAAFTLVKVFSPISHISGVKTDTIQKQRGKNPKNGEHLDKMRLERLSATVFGQTRVAAELLISVHQNLSGARLFLRQWP